VAVGPAGRLWRRRETNSSDVLSFADGLTVTTKSWTSAFGATRFDDFDFSGGRPAGVAVTSATFNFTFAPSRANDDACFYVEVRRASTNALLGTHGSSGSPSACSTGSTVSATVSISAEVTNTDIANDLRVRVYANNSTNRPLKIDLASVTLTDPGSQRRCSRSAGTTRRTRPLRSCSGRSWPRRAPPTRPSATSRPAFNAARLPQVHAEPG
jgi:hypothetical protein